MHVRKNLREARNSRIAVLPKGKKFKSRAKQDILGIKMIEVIAGLVAGLVNGIGLAGLGYAKTLKDGGLENFDEKKFVQTCVVGGIVGAGAGFAGVSYAVGGTWAASSGVIVVIEYIKKTIWRAITKKPISKKPVVA